MDGYAKMNAAIAKAEKEEREWDEIDRMPFGQRMNSLMGKSKRGAKASSSGRSTQGTAQGLKWVFFFFSLIKFLCIEFSIWESILMK